MSAPTRLAPPPTEYQPSNTYNTSSSMSNSSANTSSSSKQDSGYSSLKTLPDSTIVSVFSYEDTGKSEKFTRSSSTRMAQHPTVLQFKKGHSKASSLPDTQVLTPSQIDFTQPVLLPNGNVNLARLQSISRPSSRADSNAANSRPSSRASNRDKAGTTAPAPGSRLNEQHTSRPLPQLDRTPSRSSSHSRTDSLTRKSERPTRTLPPVPVPVTVRQETQSVHPTPPPTPPPANTKPISLAALPPSDSNLSISRNFSMPLKHPPYKPPDPHAGPSMVSLVPSEGEDLDGFHVRNTYAQLDATGVRGDGFEDGVERTRARLGDGQASQMRAQNAIADKSEKSKELTYNEVEVLAGVDRFGFFSVPSHDRLILLPGGPFLKRLRKVIAGDKRFPPNAKTVNSIPPSTVPPKETTRALKWANMLKRHIAYNGLPTGNWDIKPGKEGKLAVRTFKGIPDCWRNAAWEVLMNRYFKLSPIQMESLYQDYRNGLERPSTYDIQIDLDVPRTISGHIQFRTRYGLGQRSLFHVLHSFSLRCGTCGYVQGMGPIAATLLCYFEPERVYATLVRLHDAYDLHSIFSPGFPGLLEAIYVQERIMEMFMPDVYQAFKYHSISTTSYATKWYITLFSNSVPFQTQLRLWDVFLLEGPDAFIVVAIAVIWAYRDHITSGASNFETVLSLLSSFFVPEDENVLLSWIGQALSDKKLRANMQQWRKDWHALVAANQHHSALL